MGRAGGGGGEELGVGGGRAAQVLQALEVTAYTIRASWSPGTVLGPYLSPAAAMMNYHNLRDFQQHKLILHFRKSGMGLGSRNQGVSGTVFLLGALGENQTLICLFPAYRGHHIALTSVCISVSPFLDRDPPASVFHLQGHCGDTGPPG